MGGVTIYIIQAYVNTYMNECVIMVILSDFAKSLFYLHSYKKMFIFIILW